MGCTKITDQCETDLSTAKVQFTDTNKINTDTNLTTWVLDIPNNNNTRMDSNKDINKGSNRDINNLNKDINNPNKDINNTNNLNRDIIINKDINLSKDTVNSNNIKITADLKDKH